MKATLFDHELASPLIIGSGPLSCDADGMIHLHRAGAGAVVTKTIRDDPAVNPQPHMYPLDNRSMINADKWSTLTGDRWIDHEIPRAAEAGVVVIASVGHTPAEAEHWVPGLDGAGASIIELVSYTEADLVPMVACARRLSHRPILAKVSPNWSNTAQVAVEAIEAGADGITAIDSLGPVLSIDIQTASPTVAGESGMGWLTGTPIRTLALRHVAEIASALRGTKTPIVGIGGVMSAHDAVEMLMAGASHIGICTLPILRGVESISKLIREMDELVASLGHSSIAAIRGLAANALFGPEDTGPKKLVFRDAPCKSCGVCVTRCPYRALELTDGQITIDHDRCHRCGLCVPSCRYGNLSLERTEQ